MGAGKEHHRQIADSELPGARCCKFASRDSTWGAFCPSSRRCSAGESWVLANSRNQRQLPTNASSSQCERTRDAVSLHELAYEKFEMLFFRCSATLFLHSADAYQSGIGNLDLLPQYSCIVESQFVIEQIQGMWSRRGASS